MATECRKRKERKRLIGLGVITLLVLEMVAIVGSLYDILIVKETVPVANVAEPIEVITSDSNTSIALFDVPLSESLQQHIYNVCENKGVPVALVIAMIDHESGFNPDVISTTGDYGLMQINQINHAWLEETYHCSDMLNSYQNVYCGISIIGSHIEKYGRLDKALMAYNMGEYGAKKAWENGITSTSYSDAILELMSEYEQEVINNARNISDER